MFNYNTKIINFIKEENLQSILKTTPFWKLNTDIRKSDILFDYTDEEIIKKNRLKDINNFIDYIDEFYKNPLYENIKLRGYQKEILNNFNNDNFLSILSSRQMGITLCLVIYIMFFIMNNKEKNVCIISNKKMTSVEIIEKFKHIYYQLPFYLKPGVKTWNYTSITFENGCKIKVGNNIDEAIGYQIHFAVFMELLYLNDKKIEKYMKTFIPVMSSLKGTKMFLINSGIGYEKSKKSLKKYFRNSENNIFKQHEYHYSLIENKSDDWKNNIIKVLGGGYYFDREYELK